MVEQTDGPLSQTPVSHHCLRPLSHTTVSGHCLRPLSQATVSGHCLRPLSQATVSGHCLRPLSQATVSRHCLTPLSHTTVSHHCLRPLSHATVSRHCLTPLSHTTVSHHCLRPLSHTTVSGHCLTPLSNLPPDIPPLPLPRTTPIRIASCIDRSEFDRPRWCPIPAHLFPSLAARFNKFSSHLHPSSRPLGRLRGYQFLGKEATSTGKKWNMGNKFVV